MAHSQSWVRSLQCKSRAFEDVHDPDPRRASHPTSSSCRSGSQALKDVVWASRQKHRKPKGGRGPPPQLLGSNKAKKPPRELAPPSSLPVRTPAGLLYPALTELSEGHPSRKVVEIIFRTSWGRKAFPGLVEMILKVQNGPRAAARFEEYREEVKFCARLHAGAARWEENARCIADGNEVMRFQCLGPMPLGGGADGYPGLWGGLQRDKAAAISTFSGSGRAHESAGGGDGRRGMLVCRVVAGQVADGVGADTFRESRVGFESVSRRDGELLVYDSRAVLPCFFIIYRL